MHLTEGGSFNPEAIDLLQAVLDEAWASLLPEQQVCTSRSVLAKRVLELAAKGERDRDRLRTYALTGIVLARGHSVSVG